MLRAAPGPSGTILIAAGVRTTLDDDVHVSFGRRATGWGLKGIPIRIEVGPRELADGRVTMVRRDTNEKVPIGVGAVSATATDLLKEIQGSMLAEATAWLRSRTEDAHTLDEAVEVAQNGFARLPFDALEELGEAKLARHAITVRCIQRADGTVPLVESEDDLFAIVGRFY